MSCDAKAAATVTRQPPLVPDSLRWVLTASCPLTLWPHPRILPFHSWYSLPRKWVSAKAMLSKLSAIIC